MRVRFNGAKQSFVEIELTLIYDEFDRKETYFDKSTKFGMLERTLK